MVYWESFNAIQYLSERSIDARHSTGMMEFSDFVFDKGLMDISLVG
jgi:hypothetical protein